MRAVLGLLTPTAAQRTLALLARPAALVLTQDGPAATGAHVSCCSIISLLQSQSE